MFFSKSFCRFFCLVLTAFHPFHILSILPYSYYIVITLKAFKFESSSFSFPTLFSAQKHPLDPQRRKDKQYDNNLNCHLHMSKKFDDNEWVMRGRMMTIINLAVVYFYSGTVPVLLVMNSFEDLDIISRFV